MVNITPRPGWPLLITSCLLIACCLYFGGVLLAGFAHWDPCAWIGGAILAGPTLALAAGQYAATFRRNTFAAAVLFTVLPLIGGGGVLIAGVLVVSLLWSGIWPLWDFVQVPLSIGAVGLALAWTGLLNFRWYKSMTAPVERPPEMDVAPAVSAGTRARRIAQHSVACIASVLILWAGFSFGIQDIPPQELRHVTAAEAHLDLPAGASDVCIRRSYRGTIAYNFAIDEKGFWDWAANVGGSIESRSSGVTVQPVTENNVIFDPFSPDHVHRFSRGWLYAFQVEDRGLYYAYDRDAGRAFFFYHGY